MRALPMAAGLTLIAVATTTLTGYVRRLALARRMIDVPGARSSHAVPTPRGGGLAIVVVLLAAFVVLAVRGVLAPAHAAALVGGVPLVAWIGWWDDVRPLPPWGRAAVHVAASVWCVAWLGGYPTLDIGAGKVALGPAGALAAVIGTVWLVNLYNFMDGIDGLAAGEGVTTGAAGGALLLAADQPGLAVAAFAVAAACGGFLVWNRPPARIFMVDVGSGVLGYVFAVLALASERAGALPVLAWGILLGVFMVDSTVTLVRRMARGERWTEAHRQHAYQRATQAGWSHRRVTTTVLILNLGLAALAGLVWRRPALLPAALLATAVALGGAYWLIDRRRPLAAVEVGDDSD